MPSIETRKVLPQFQLKRASYLKILPQYAGVDNPLPQSLNDSLTQSPPQQTDDPSRIRANSRENISISRD
ncbi:unnamed protein product, partial [Mesorhabditis belari]|uniref:Cystinosin n=1 Tax=Mesorhabditis belari TaxID=2138241 RepID=A0AAF3EPM4_9BILA